MKITGTLICSRCLQEFTATGELVTSVGHDGSLISELEPDIATTAILQAHRCDPQP